MLAVPSETISSANFTRQPCAAVFCFSGGSSQEQFVSPFVLPKLPSRVYVRFGEAITLEGLDKRDKDACQAAYERVKVCDYDQSFEMCRRTTILF